MQLNVKTILNLKERHSHFVYFDVRAIAFLRRYGPTDRFAISDHALRERRQRRAPLPAAPGRDPPAETGSEPAPPPSMTAQADLAPPKAALEGVSITAAAGSLVVSHSGAGIESTAAVRTSAGASDPQALRRKAARTGKIFIDYLRNGEGASAVAPYSTRARTGAPIALPIDWQELKTLKGGDVFHMKDAIQRLKKDPWRAMTKSSIAEQKLPLT
jgi:hypothetical protein